MRCQDDGPGRRRGSGLEMAAEGASRDAGKVGEGLFSGENPRRVSFVATRSSFLET